MAAKPVRYDSRGGGSLVVEGSIDDRGHVGSCDKIEAVRQKLRMRSPLRARRRLQ
jgi:hypothetical protein